MDQARIPAVFVSSTSYDLDQIRADLKQFIEQLGYDAVLSEYHSFPIDPDLQTVENCLRAVDRRADIFVLVVGGRYGSQTDEGKSITNLEYLRARYKEIPIYAFVTKTILHILPVWKSNQNADFKSVVDSTKLFNFVDELMNSDKVWVYPFERVQDIIGVLKTQLAYLFLECLELRRQVRQSHLPETVRQLRGEALRLVLEKPDAWAPRLLSQMLAEEIESLRSRRRDVEYEIPSGQDITTLDIVELLKWLQNKGSDFNRLALTSANLTNTIWQEAMSHQDNIEYIVHVAKRFCGIYRTYLEWTEDFKRIPYDERYNTLLTKLRFWGIQILIDIEKFSAKLQADIKTALLISDKEDVAIEANLVFSFAGVDDLTEEINQLVHHYMG
jgi:hypothetical protein